MIGPGAVQPAPSYGVMDHYLGAKGEQYFGWQGRPRILQGLWNRANRRYPSTDQNMHLHARTPQTLGNLLTSAGMEVLDVHVVREAWPRGRHLLWKLSPRVFRMASFVWAVMTRRCQLLAVCRRAPGPAERGAE